VIVSQNVTQVLKSNAGLVFSAEGQAREMPAFFGGGTRDSEGGADSVG